MPLQDYQEEAPIQITQDMVMGDTLKKRKRLSDLMDNPKVMDFIAKQDAAIMEQRFLQSNPKLQEQFMLAREKARLRPAAPPPAGYRVNPDGTMAFVPGGPADPKQAGALKPNLTKLKPGERMTADGNVEAIPGSSEYIKQSGLHSKDYGAMLTIATTTQNTKDKIAEILDKKNEGDFNSNFGGYNALATQYFPGAQDMRQRIESLKSDLKGAGLNIIRSGGGIGTMTEKEWPIVERMIDSISPTLDEKTARNRIAQVGAYMEKLNSNASDVYQNEWGNTQFTKRRAQGTPPPASPDMPPPGAVRRKN